MIFDFFNLALKNLKHRKLRSWLTIIGILIGITAVVALVSLGQGMQDYIHEEFEKLGSDKIIIMPKGMGPPGTAGPSLILTSKDLEIIENVRGVKWAIGFLVKQGQAKYKGEAGIGFGIGMDPEETKLLKEIQSYEILKGRDLKKGDKYKVLVGYNHGYGDVWDKPVKIGSTIEIEGVDFKVVGILEKIGNPVDDGALYMTKETLKEILDVEDEESQILVKTEKGFEPANVAKTIERKLRQSRGEKEDQETFNVQTSEQLLNTFQNIFGVVQAILVGIAAISLFVGGVGAMNTMYTTVLERTKEIGTMKAVGAKNSDIMLLFLFESGIYGLTGGVIGVILGLGMSKGVEMVAGNYLGVGIFQASMAWWLIVGALAFSFIVGCISGIAPALQAAKLKPVDALRYE